MYVGEEVKFDETQLLARVFGRFCTNLQHLLKVFILGGSDSGKTNVAKYISSILQNNKYFGPTAEIRWLEAPSKKSAITAMLTPTTGNLLMVFDDVSFLLKGVSREMDLFSNLEARVRHVVIPEDKKMALIYCTHYAYSIAPFLREADFVLLTGLKLVQIEKFSSDRELGSYFKRNELSTFYGVCKSVRDARADDPWIWFGDDKIDVTKWRPLLVSGDDKFISKIPKVEWFDNQLYKYYPPPLDETLGKVEAKFGRDYRREIEQVLTESTITQRKHVREESDYLG